VDIIGSASPLADAEIIAVLSDSLAALGFSDFSTLLNHRQVIGGIARVSGLEEEAAGGVYRALDKLDKIGADGVRAELERSGVTADAAERILALVMLEGEPDTVLRELHQYLQDDERACAALDNLRQIIAALDGMGVPPERYRLSPRLARGLSYYTGAVFETITAHWPAGSLLGGGRYDELIGMFTGRPVPTVGLAFGIDRLHDVMEELGIGPRAQTTAYVYVTMFNADHAAHSLHLASQLRAAGIPAITALEPDVNLGKQFKEVDRKGIRYALVLGPDELARGEVSIRDMQSGEQRNVARDAIVEALIHARSTH
jgi:histidyl-tRNA synthetase